MSGSGGWGVPTHPPALDVPDEQMYEVPAEDIHGHDNAAKLRANDHLRWYEYWTHQIEGVENMYRLEADRLEARKRKQLAKMEAKKLFHADVLKRFHQAWLERFPKDGKTIPLPSGTLKSVTRTKPVVTVTDGQALMAWCRQNLRSAVTLRSTSVVSKTKVGEHYAATGEVPDGAVVAPPGTSFSVVLDDGLDQ